FLRTGQRRTQCDTPYLHDALPIYERGAELRVRIAQTDVSCQRQREPAAGGRPVHRRDHREREVTNLLDPAGGDFLELEELADAQDRKSTRLNSSHVKISYAGFCLK